MARKNEARLAHLSAETARAAAREADHRQALRARVAVGAMIRAELARRGIDPASARALRHCDEAAAELAGLGDADGPVRDDGAAADNEAAADAFAARMISLTQRVADETAPDGVPDLADASLAILLAWCLGTARLPQPGGCDAAV